MVGGWGFEPQTPAMRTDHLDLAAPINCVYVLFVRPLHKLTCWQPYVQTASCYREHQNERRGFLESKFQRELNQSRIVTGRSDATEVARVTGNLTCVRIDGCCCDRAKVANRVCKIYVVKEVKKFGAELDVPGFTNREALD